MKTGLPRGHTRLAMLVLAAISTLAAVWPSAPELQAGTSAGEPTWAPLAGAGPARVAAQLPPSRTCQSPALEGAFPSGPAELRLVRDEAGNYWQIQAGCRHAVVPFVMDAATLEAIPRGEDVSWISYGLPQAVPTLAPLPNPAYSQLPEYLRGLPPVQLTPTPSTQPPPGVLTGYANRVLVVNPAQPDEVWVLDGRLRHRVLVYFPYCAVYPRALPLCGGDADASVVSALALSRGGDPAVGPPFPYLLPRRPEVASDCRLLFPSLSLPVPESCTDLYGRLLLRDLLQVRPTRDENERAALIELARVRADEAAPYVATIDEIPLGEPAPYYGWARGESTVISDRPRLPDARNCGRNPPCSRRFREARVITLGQFAKDPAAYAGQDVHVERGVACQVRYDRGRNVTTFSYGLGTVTVAAVAPGREAAQDSELVSNAVLEIAASVSSAASAFFNTPGQFVVFEYRRIGGGICEETG